MQARLRYKLVLHEITCHHLLVVCAVIALRMQLCAVNASDNGYSMFTSRSRNPQSTAVVKIAHHYTGAATSGVIGDAQTAHWTAEPVLSFYWSSGDDFLTTVHEACLTHSCYTTQCTVFYCAMVQTTALCHCAWQLSVLCLDIACCAALVLLLQALVTAAEALSNSISALKSKLLSGSERSQT
eukprot:21077-Heterococcus_DN1.PRE.1